MRRASSRALAISPTAALVTDTYSERPPTRRETSATEPSMASTAAWTATTPACCSSAPRRTRSPIAEVSRAPSDTPSLAPCTSTTSPFSPSAIRRKSDASWPISSRESVGGLAVRSPEAIRSAARPSVRNGTVIARAATQASSAATANTTATVPRSPVQNARRRARSGSSASHDTTSPPAWVRRETSQPPSSRCSPSGAPAARSNGSRPGPKRVTIAPDGPRSADGAAVASHTCSAISRSPRVPMPATALAWTRCAAQTYSRSMSARYRT